jgi:hypothetical protein
MTLALLLLGIILASAGIQGTQAQLGALLVSDFSGAGSFWYFIAGIFIVGALGYYSPLQGTSRLVIVLIILVFLLSNQGFFAQFTNALKNPVVPPAPTPMPSPTPVLPAGSTSTIAPASTSQVATGTAAANSIASAVEAGQPLMALAPLTDYLSFGEL